jgi:glucosamine 6-phosphate synthetase-like amidotransferase/phosphosugar isomerase protein
VLVKRGYKFSTDTDTEAVAMLCKYVWDSQPHKRLNFTELIKTVVKELVSWKFSSDTLQLTPSGRLLCVRLQVDPLPR